MNLIWILKQYLNHVLIYFLKRYEHFSIIKSFRRTGTDSEALQEARKYNNNTKQ